MEQQKTEKTNNQPMQGFQIKRLFVKEQSCKLAYSNTLFKEEWKPEIQLEMSQRQELVEPDIYEITLQFNIVGKQQGRTAFSLDVQQAGLFELKNYSQEQLHYLLHAYCPSILFPYARKIVADKILDASLPPLVLAPINFEALYKERQKAAVPEAV